MLQKTLQFEGNFGSVFSIDAEVMWHVLQEGPLGSDG